MRNRAEHRQLALDQMIAGLALLFVILSPGLLMGSDAGSSPLDIPLEDRGWLGLGYHLRTPEAGTKEGQSWLLAHRVVAGGPADTAGIHQGDIISHIDGNPVEFESDLDSLEFFARIQPSQTVEFTVVRSGEPLEIQVEAGPMTEEMYDGWKKMYRSMVESSPPTARRPPPPR